MPRQSTVAFLYIAYATLTIGLLVTSLLSPLHYRTIQGRFLRVYGVLLVYDSPPPADAWTPDPSGFSTSSSLSSTSSSASSSNRSSDSSVSFSSSSAESSNASTETPLVSGIVSPALDNGWDGTAPYTFFRLEQHVTEVCHSGDGDVDVDWLEDHEAKMQTILATSSAASSSHAGSDDSSSSGDTVRRFTVSVRDLTAYELRRVMSAYLAFAAAALVASIVLIIAAIVHIVPDVQWIKLSLVSATLFSLSVLSSFLCTIMAAVISVQNGLYIPIAMGFYSRTFEIGYKSGVSSGLSTAIASVVLGVISLIVVFFAQTR